MPRRELILTAVFCAGLAGWASGQPAPISHHDAFSKESVIKADVASLHDTRLVAVLDTPIPAKTNVIWCGTLQLAWNEAIGLVGEKLRFVNQPPLVEQLNQQDFTKNDLDPGSYVALADFERNHVEAKIREALEKVFHGAASPELIPPVPPHPGPDDFVAYAYLYKNLAFPHPFQEENDRSFYLDNLSIRDRLKGFGFPKSEDASWAKVVSQVSIFDYQSEKDFVIKIATKQPQDELILARVTPGATLQETVNGVLKRMASGARATVGEEDILWIPQLNYDLRKNFDELENLTLQSGPNARVHNLVTKQVKQLVRFQLNKEGAMLKSEAVITMIGAAMALHIDRHVMVFNEPFLILMKRADAPQPYFAMWVGNASLLEAAK